MTERAGAVGQGCLPSQESSQLSGRDSGLSVNPDESQDF